MTLNNWSENEYDEIVSYMATRPFWIIGKEVGTKNNTPHLQIYFESKTPTKFSTIKNLNNRFHIEKAKGSREDNYKYCSKDGNYKTNINPEVDFIKKEKKDKNKLLKQEKENFMYHYTNHNNIISEETFLTYMNEFDIDELGEPFKSMIIKDLRLYKESKDCFWCETLRKKYESDDDD